jgi:hypothetical protein
MPVRVDVFTNEGMGRGVLRGARSPRDLLEAGFPIEIDDVTWQAFTAAGPTPSGPVAIAPDDIILLVADDDPFLPVHAAWHAVTIWAGPLVMSGELPTMPGFDPGRALTRPSGEFVLLRDLRIALAERPEAGEIAVEHGLVNRYAVEAIEADLDLGFHFPGAAVREASARPLA